MSTLLLDGDSLTIEQVNQIAFDPTTLVAIADSALAKMRLACGGRRLGGAGEVIYGVTTGFGEFANVVISRENIEKLQENLIRSHAVGAGDPIEAPIMRAMMALRINALAKGYSGIRIETVRTLVEMLNGNIVPVAPMQGSVGSSGDLVPLAHLVLAAMGEGSVWKDGAIVPSGPSWNAAESCRSCSAPRKDSRSSTARR